MGKITAGTLGGHPRDQRSREAVSAVSVGGRLREIASSKAALLTNLLSSVSGGKKGEGASFKPCVPGMREGWEGSPLLKKKRYLKFKKVN